MQKKTKNKKREGRFVCGYMWAQMAKLQMPTCDAGYSSKEGRISQVSCFVLAPYISHHGKDRYSCKQSDGFYMLVLNNRGN